LFQTIVVVGASLTAGCNTSALSLGSPDGGGSVDGSADLTGWPTIGIDFGWPPIMPPDLAWPVIDASWPTIMPPPDLSRTDGSD
jgi:hypothetical protein